MGAAGPWWGAFASASETICRFPLLCSTFGPEVGGLLTAGPTATPSAAALRAGGAQSRCVGCRLEIVTPEPTPLGATGPARRRSSPPRGTAAAERRGAGTSPIFPRARSLPTRHVAYAQDERSDRSVGFPSRPAFTINASGSSATRRSDIRTLARGDVNCCRLNIPFIDGPFAYLAFDVGRPTVLERVRVDAPRRCHDFFPRYPQPDDVGVGIP